MPQNFNIEPYYDDFNKHKHFHKILFRPGYSLQTRELTQMQSILQNQISSMGDHLFKNGTMIIPGELSFDNNLHYVKLQATSNSTVSTFIDLLVDKIMVGTSGIRAKVIAVTKATATVPDTIYVKYLDGGTSGTVDSFGNNENITPEDIAFAAYNVQSQSVAATGIGSSASIKEGVYYVNGYFVLCEPQTLILDSYSNTPSYNIGFNILETIVTPELDETLLDNAQGSYNFAAPGSHRYGITLQLAKNTDIALSTNIDKFIQLTILINGIVQTPINQTQYAELAKTMARRTFDESGDYVVNDFVFNTREHRNNNRGPWVTNTAYARGDIVVVAGMVYTAETNATSGSNSAAWPSDELTTYNDGGVVWRYSSSPDYNLGVYTPAQGGLESSIAIAVEPGKAYVKGYEIEKVGSTFLTVPKARTTIFNPIGNSAGLIGNYILVTNVHSIPDLSLMPSVDYYSAMTTTAGSPSAAGSLSGHGRIRYFELYSGVVGTSTAIYRVGLFDSIMNAGVDFDRTVKQLYVNTGSTLTNFTANISPILVPMPGTVTMVGSTGVATGTGTNFTNLVVGDIVSVGGRIHQVSVITSSSLMTLVASIDTMIDITVGVVLNVLTTKILNPESSNLLFPVKDFVKTLRDSGGSNQLSYSVYQRFTGTTNVSGLITFSMPTDPTCGNTFASPYINGNYVGSSGDGVLKNLTNIEVALSSGNKTCTINYGLASTAVSLIICVDKIGPIETEKHKTLTYASKIVTTIAEGTKRIISLGKADGYKVHSVKMTAGNYQTPTGGYTIDITNRFAFDDGQTDSYYGLSSIVLRDGQIAPIAPFTIIYSYFVHTGIGDYFTVNSYDLEYSKIPFYLNSTPLSDYIDFRPRVDDAGLTFTGTGGSVAHLPKMGIGLKYQYEYYLPRIDKLCLESDGSFNLISGVPSISPKEPVSSTTGMLLNVISIGAYTASKSNVNIKNVNNKRYTMRDIGRLDDRISNLEYYTTLSLIEQDTSNLSITDADGLTRYKNGFIVDGFAGHGIGDNTALDYRCSIDELNKALRPFNVMKNVPLYETSMNNRNTNFYTMTGDLVTLPYTHTAYVVQPFASAQELVNPFSVFTFYGNCQINPASDDWIETERAPDRTFQAEGTTVNSGEIGTVWGLWNTIWSGTVVTGQSVSTSNVALTSVQLMNGEGFLQNPDGTWAPDAWLHHTIVGTSTTTTTKISVTNTATTKATQSNQSRGGITTSIQPTVNTSYNGDLRLSRTDVPYMRSRNIAFITYGLKSNRNMYATFDGADVNQFITPATVIRLNNISGFSNLYDFTTNAGDNATRAARKINGNLDLSLNKGMIVVGQTSGATAVVLYQEPVAIGATAVNIYIANIIGTFALNEVIIGSMDGLTVGSRGTIAITPVVRAIGSQLTTNISGVICGLFSIPSSDALHFRTGIRDLSFKDTLSLAQSTTMCSVSYHATGLHDIWQNQYTATRNSMYVQTAVTGNQTLLSAGSTSSVLSSVINNVSQAIVPWDPLAQTFLVNTPWGMFITKVDLYFGAKETTTNIPVHIEIREVVNGFPANITAPFSKVYKDPIDINVSANGSIATTFNFESPVYLESGKEYAVVILSDSNVYKVFVSQMGGVDSTTGATISSQPALGVLFKSSNGSTWTPSQMEDLKFTIYRAKFNTNVTGLVTFANDSSSSVALIPDALHFTLNSYKVRVSHKDHQMPVGSKVILSGCVDSVGILAASLNSTFVIADVDLDSYSITMVSLPNATLSAGGSLIRATENMQFDLAHVSIAELVFPNTTLDHNVKFTSGQSVNGTESPYVKDTIFTPFTVNRDVTLLNPAMVPSSINETYLMANAKSLEVQVVLNSNNDSVSPVIDVQRLSAILVSNKINAPTLANFNVSELDDRIVLVAANKIAFSAVYNSIYTLSSNTVEAAALATLSAGKYISATSTGSIINIGNKLVTKTMVIGAEFHAILADTVLVEAVNANTITLIQHQRFIDEICPLYGSAYNKYVSKEIVLANPSTYLKIKLGAVFPISGDVAFYYRTNSVGGAIALTNLSWIKVSPIGSVVRSNNITDVNIDVPNIPTFDSVQIKIVLVGGSSSQIPMCKDLRIIACA